jgi:catechol 2,3-dioxygenase-like lactoylglutathione lyase family enzyme
MNKEKVVIGYRHVGIITKDIKKSVNFYNQILGLEIIQEFSDSSDYINEITGLTNATAHFVKLKTQDGAVLELLEYPTHKTEPVDVSIINVGVLHIALRVENADKAYEHLMKIGVKTLSKPVISSEGIAKVFFCIDPDNIRVELVEMLNL